MHDELNDNLPIAFKNNPKIKESIVYIATTGYKKFPKGSDGIARNKYQSGNDLLLQTPDFYESFVKKRLKQTFNRAYRYIEALYDGRNPYMEIIERNFAYLEHIIETGDWSALRRTPPPLAVKDDPLANMRRARQRTHQQTAANITVLRHA